MQRRAIFRRISVTDALYKEIVEDKAHFQKVIGGGKWSVSDTISEWRKIAIAKAQDSDSKKQKRG